MDTVQVKDRQFMLFIKGEEIQKQIARVAKQINCDYAGKTPLFICVLNGAFMFAADLLKRVTLPCQISFVRLSSYEGVSSTGIIKEIVGLTEDVTGRDVIVIEDIVDTGLTMKRMLHTLSERGPASVCVASLLLKPSKLQVKVNVHYVAMEIPDNFIVGYGLDYDGFGRNLPDIYVLADGGQSEIEKLKLLYYKMNKMLNIVIFGAPGSGKGTQSERIVAKYGINHISTGDVLRAEIKNGTELGQTAKGYIDQGQLIPDALMIDILASVFDGFKNSKGVIFDGFPRTIAQAEALKKMLAERGQEVTVMLDLDVPEDELMTRLIKRGQESGRADDNEETIKKRLTVYHSQTAPLIDWYKAENKYSHINGLGTMEGIFADICKAIDAVK